MGGQQPQAFRTDQGLPLIKRAVTALGHDIRLEWPGSLPKQRGGRTGGKCSHGRDALRQADPRNTARYLIALLEAETLTPCLFGRLKGPSKEYLRAATQRALMAFFTGYHALDAS